MTSVAVIGGGVVGTAVALALARRDVGVVLFEARDELAGAALARLTGRSAVARAEAHPRPRELSGEGEHRISYWQVSEEN